MTFDKVNWKTFSHISQFVIQLNEVFGKSIHTVQLYAHLINRTKATNGEAIQRHIDVFKNFVTKYKDFIIEKDLSKFNNPVITYSKKVYIDLKEVFSQADNETKETIWNHLLVISNNISPDSKIADMLKNIGKDTKEGEFLTNVFKKIESSVEPNNADPMSAIMGLMTSGVFGELVNGMTKEMSSGNLNMGKLFGTMQNMFSNMSNLEGSEGENKNESKSDESSSSNVSSTLDKAD